MKITEPQEIKMEMSIAEVTALTKFLGGTSVANREQAGCTNAQANILSDMYGALGNFLEKFLAD